MLLQNQQVELSKILELKDNEISSRHMEIATILEENVNLKEKLKVNCHLVLFRFLFD